VRSALCGSLAFALWPAWLTMVIRWSDRLRVVPAVDTTRRALTCLHIGLLAIVLVGLTAPVTLAPTFGRQVRTTYTVVLQREFQAEGELVAYMRIRREFAARAAAPVLAGLVRKIRDISGPPQGDNGATSTQTDLARRLGELQGGGAGGEDPARIVS